MPPEVLGLPGSKAEDLQAVEASVEATPAGVFAMAAREDLLEVAVFPEAAHAVAAEASAEAVFVVAASAEAVLVAVVSPEAAGAGAKSIYLGVASAFSPMKREVMLDLPFTFSLNISLASLSGATMCTARPNGKIASMSRGPGNK